MTAHSSRPSLTLATAIADISAALGRSDSQLHRLDDLDRRREAETLVLTALGLARSMLYQHPDHELSGAEQALLADWTRQRRAGMPLAYLSGHREFWSLSLEVTPDVLIPRPETELLVERALQHGQNLSHTLRRPVRVLELGTGSGAIILALRKEQALWDLTAVDLSSAALEIAQRNSQKLALKDIQFLHGSWFEPVGQQLFDLIISNPPYVAADDPCLQQDSLRYEPTLALTPGADAMHDLRTLITRVPAHLSPGGWLLLEHGHTQASEVRAELLTRGYTEVQSHRDLAGQWRASEGRIPSSREDAIPC